MSLLRQRPRRRDPRRRPDPLVRLAAEPFRSADLILLCTFGPDLTRHEHTRTSVAHSFRPGTTGH